MNNKNLPPDFIKPLLDHSAATLDDSTVDRLHAARNLALKRHRVLQHSPVLAWLSHHGLWVGAPTTGHKKMTWAFALLLVACLVSSAAYLHHVNTDHDHSDLDIAILTDDLPVDAYVE